MIANELLGESYWSRGEFHSSVMHFERAAALYDPVKHPALIPKYVGYDLGMACRTIGAQTLWYLGYPDRALTWSREGVALAQRIAHHFTLAFAYCHAAILRWLRREYVELLELAELGLAIAREHDFVMWEAYTTLMVGCARAARGHQDGLDLIRRGMAGYRSGGHEVEYAFFDGLLADACLRLKRFDDGLVAVDEGLTHMERHGARMYDRSDRSCID